MYLHNPGVREVQGVLIQLGCSEDTFLGCRRQTPQFPHFVERAREFRGVF